MQTESGRPEKVEALHALALTGSHTHDGQPREGFIHCGISISAWKHRSHRRIRSLAQRIACGIEAKKME